MSRTVMKPEERKSQLIGIALDLFMKQGYVNTSIKDIYSQANGSFGMFYHHFSSKEEIFEAAMDRYTDLFVAGISDILLDQQVSYERRYRNVLQHWLKMINGRDMVRGTRHDEEVFRVLSGKMLSGAVNPAESYIEEGIRRGLFAAADSRSAAIFVIYGIYGLIIEEYKRTGNNQNAGDILTGAAALAAGILKFEGLGGAAVKEDGNV